MCVFCSWQSPTGIDYTVDQAIVGSANPKQETEKQRCCNTITIYEHTHPSSIPSYLKNPLINPPKLTSSSTAHLPVVILDYSSINPIL
jgi:hypothetical protein